MSGICVYACEFINVASLFTVSARIKATSNGSKANKIPYGYIDDAIWHTNAWDEV
jgi:hypothetical protein